MSKKTKVELANKNYELSETKEDKSNAQQECVCLQRDLRGERVSKNKLQAKYEKFKAHMVRKVETNVAMQKSCSNAPVWFWMNVDKWLWREEGNG